MVFPNGLFEGSIVCRISSLRRTPSRLLWSLDPFFFAWAEMLSSRNPRFAFQGVGFLIYGSILRSLFVSTIRCFLFFGTNARGTFGFPIRVIKPFSLSFFVRPRRTGSAPDAVRFACPLDASSSSPPATHVLSCRRLAGPLLSPFRHIISSSLLAGSRAQLRQGPIENASFSFGAWLLLFLLTRCRYPAYYLLIRRTCPLSEVIAARPCLPVLFRTPGRDAL